MTYNPVDSVAAPSAERFDNVFVTPVAYKAFLQTGSWPDKTMFALEAATPPAKAPSTTGAITRKASPD
jgi:hypothetical protein